MSLKCAQIILRLASSAIDCQHVHLVDMTLISGIKLTRWWIFTNYKKASTYTSVLSGMRVQDKYILYHQAVHDLVFKPPYNKLYMVCGSVCFQLWQMIPRPSHIIIWILAFKKYFSTALNRNIVLRKLKKNLSLLITLGIHFKKKCI